MVIKIQKINRFLLNINDLKKKPSKCLTLKSLFFCKAYFPKSFPKSAPKPPFFSTAAVASLISTFPSPF